MIPESIQQMTNLKQETATEISVQKPITEGGVFIVVGSFPDILSARNLLNELIAKGFNKAGLLPANGVETNRVYVMRYKSYQEAKKDLPKIRRNVNKDAWILVE
jgi:hypothetical protein